VSIGVLPNIDLIKRIRQRGERCLVLVLSMHEEDNYAERVLRAGAQGYIMKQEVCGNVLKAIRKVLAGGIWLSEAMANQLFSKIVAGSEKAATSLISKLSDRELEVFTLIGKGWDPRVIASELCISARSVDSHREHIKKKLSLNSTRVLILYASEWLKDEIGYTGGYRLN